MAIIEGTEFNDELFANSTGDEVLGLEGNDTLDASPGQGNNTLDGGSGDDELFAGIDDLLLGGEGDDTLDARSGRGGNRLEAGVGNDLLLAATNDTLLGGIGNDRLFAGTENGVLKGGTGSDQFWLVQTEVPIQPNIVNRFIQTIDQIGIGGLSDVTAFEDLSFVVQDGNTVITATVEGEEVQLGILTAFTGTLTADDFIFEDSPALDVPGPVASDDTFTVAENSEAGTVVGTVIATDIEITDDPEDSDALTYEIISGNADPNGNGTTAFTIDEDSGEITVLDSGDLDFESDTSSFNLIVNVTDLEGLSDEATITINLNNIDEPGNDPPVAEDATFTIDENSAVDTPVGTVVASDPDVGDTLTYAITTGNDAGAFEINETTGLITVADSAPLDFETTESFPLTVTVTDSEGLTDEAAVIINLEDVNEAPVAEDATFTIDENSAEGTEVGTVAASDPDAGDILTYVISAGNEAGAFTIDAATGAITVANSAPLDFETTESFELTVTVSDIGELTDEATVTVNLNNIDELDIDDEDVNAPPVAEDATFTIDENSAVNTPVGTVVASDPDAGDTLTYAITTGNDAGAFNIDAATGAITVVDSAPLDFETTESFPLTVTVSDGELTDEAAVTINLEDVNEAPVAEDATFTIDENSAVNTPVGTVVASDPDAGDTLTYAITTGNEAGAFNIDPATGAITVVDSAPLDFETTESFPLTVTVTDSGGLTDEAAVTINLEDVNEAPVAEDATFTIDENSAVNTPVGTVVASDPDAGDTLTYAITTGNDAGVFNIDAATGAITVVDSAPLDFETTESFPLTVTVSDGELTDEAAVTINLEDVNEAPVAEDATFTIDENSAVNTPVGTVVASDPDAGDTLTYAITTGNEAGAFTIDTATGAITVADSAPLDFETTESFGLTITVMDSGGLTDQATVTINLDDIDEDGDGIQDSIEALAGDRNSDGTPDSEQSNVASIPSLTGDFFTLVAPEGIRFTGVEVTADFNGDGIDNDDLVNPTGNGFSFLDGFLNYRIEPLDPNEPLGDGPLELEISILLPNNTNATNTYFKFNSVTSQLEEFTYDGETGAEFFDVGLGTNSQNLVVLHFIDGGRGDDDGLVNGVITDPGGFGFLANPTVTLTESGGIFTVGGTEGLAVPLTFTLTENESAFVNEISVYRLDDNTDTRISEEVIFSEVDTGLTGGLTRELQFTGGDRLEFVINTGETSFSSRLNSNQVEISGETENSFNLAWEDTNVDDLLFGGDFNDFIFNVGVGTPLVLNQLVAINQGEEEQELLDLRQLPGQTVEVGITVNRDAAFDNFVGFYEIDNEEGAIGTLNPGDAGYTDAAIERSRALDLNSSNTSANLDGGSLYAPFIISNGTQDNFEDVYFPFIAGNADGFDHVRLLGDNVFGFEDLQGGGRPRL